MIAAVRGALGRSVRLGAGPTRLCALAAALAARSRRPLVVDDRSASRYLAEQPVELLGHWPGLESLVQPLGRLGVRTLGELAALGRHSMADRFGRQGVLAHRLATGEDIPLQTRCLEDHLEESLQLEHSSSGLVLERVLALLVDRLLARSERRGRTLGAVTLSARLVEGGTWRERIVFRQALTDSRRILLALSPPLSLLPAPAEALCLCVERFGPPSGEQRVLLEQDRAARLERLREAVGQARAFAGHGAALRAMCIDPDSRVPERRVVLAPLPG